MARVSFVEPEQADPRIKEVYGARQPVPNMFKVMGHCPEIGSSFLRLGLAILKGEKLPPKVRELATLRISFINNAEYAITKHVPRALQAGLSQEQIDDLPDWRKSKLFSKQERAVLAYTDKFEKCKGVKDKTFAELRNYLDEDEIVELSIVIGNYSVLSRILMALEIELEQ